VATEQQESKRPAVSPKQPNPEDHLPDPGDDQVVALLKLSMGMQRDSSQQIIGQVIDLRTEVKAAVEAGNVVATRVTRLEEQHGQTKAKAERSELKVAELEQQVNLWRGVTVAGGALLAILGTVGAVARLFVHP
jgi:hypothetical protein